MLNTKRGFTLAAALILSACGGGGDGGTVSAPDEGTPITLTSDNYADVATTTFTGATIASSMGSGGTAALGSGQVGALQAWASLARSRMQAMSVRTAAMVSGSQSLDCAQSGSVTITATDANANGSFDAGDSLSLEYANCVEDGTTTNGRLTFALTDALTGSLGSDVYSFGATMTFTTFTVADNTATVAANGDISIKTARTAYHVGQDKLSSSTFSSMVTANGTTESRFFNSFDATTNLSVAETATSLAGVMGGTNVLGVHVVTLATTTPFKQRYADGYPYAGVAVMTGASSATVKMTALSNTQFRLDLDADANGTVDASTTLNWAAVF